ncbi:WD40/YVTN/BNR-like repeat-containing protein [Winogradskyella psychrotolerans]|uniref:WD40/YVTN/BNR-like repeat-containing protein n=1 Tax=Winogradskyella psychrotolerans TaxID=1344585 RepID=UPI001C070358|nr:oxidoreductase [Winogradskyella psychrotolerans]MBU2929695.1 oxidoreductase [Winogradskyella psychrotolerans]
MRLIIFCLLLIGIVSCKSEDQLKSRNFSKVNFEMLWEDSELSVRALEIGENDKFYFAGNNSGIGMSYMDGIDPLRNIKIISYDSLAKPMLEFRSIAETTKDYFFMSVSSPSYLYKLSKNDYFGLEIQPKLVYQETHPKAFYDSMDFWNDEEGIAIGDPTDNCMSIIITRDSGESWTKLSCDDLPKAKEGEAAFAASDTNIAIIGDHTWVATGGKSSRILYSPDKGKTWDVFDTPIIQGKATTGIYSIDFYDKKNGFAIGGDYTQPNDTLQNKMRTKDGGKTWEIVASGKGPGYRSCVQYVPNSNGKELIAIGFKGIDYSNNAGDSWRHLSDEGFYTIRFLNDSTAYAAGKGRISKLTFRE